MTHSNQTSGVEQGAAQVRHNRPIKGVLKFPLPRDIPEVWFQIFLPKKSDTFRHLPPIYTISPLKLHLHKHLY